VLQKTKKNMFQKIVKASIYLLVFLMPLFWLPFSFEAYEINKIYLLVFLTAMGILAWIGRMIFQDKKIVFIRTPLDFFVLGYLAIMILSVIFTKDKTSSLFGFYARFWPSLLTVVSLTGLYFLITNNVAVNKAINKAGKKEDPQTSNDGKATKKEEYQSFISVRRLLNLFFISGFVANIIFIFSLFNLWNKAAQMVGVSLPPLMQNRIFNTIGSLQAFAVFTAVMLATVLVYLAFESRVYEGLNEERKKKKRINSQIWLYVLAFLDLGLLIILNFLPSWLCIFLALTVFVALAFWKRMFREDVQRLSLPVFFWLIALIFLFVNPIRGLLPKTSLLANLPQEAILSQKFSWQTAFYSLRENAALGSGLGNFHYVFAKYKPAAFLNTNLWQLRFDRAGNYVAEMLGTTGILGVLGLLILTAMFFLISYLYIKSANKEKTSGFAESTKRILDVPDNSQIQSGLLFARHIPIFIAFSALFFAQFFYTQNATLGFSFWLMLSLGVVSWGRGAKEKTYSFKDFPEAGLLLSIGFWSALLAFIFLFFVMSRYYLADVAYRQYVNNPGQNLTKLEKAAQSNGFGPTYYLALSVAYMQKFYEIANQQNPDVQQAATFASLATQAIKKAEDLGPNWVICAEVAGVIYRDLQAVASGSTDWAIKHFERVLQLEPLNPPALTELGKLKLAGGDKEAAKALFEKAAAMKKDYVESSLQLVLLDEAEGKQQDALARLENLVKSAPFSVEARFQLARIYYNNQEYEKAEQQALAALSIFPNHSNSLFLLGMVYEKTNRNDLALQKMEKVLELNPNNQQVKNEIAKLKQPPVIEQPKPVIEQPKNEKEK